MVVRNFTTDQNKLSIAEISYYDQEKNATEKYILEAIRANETPSQVSENNPTVPSLHCDDAADPEPSADDKYFPALFPTFISQAATNHYDKMSTPFSVSFGTNEKNHISPLCSVWLEIHKIFTWLTLRIFEFRDNLEKKRL